MVKTDIGIITITVERDSYGLAACFPCHFQAKTTLPSPLAFLRTGREQRRGTPSACLSRYRSHHRTTLVWLRYDELSLKMIRDSNVLIPATFIPVSRLLATDQPLPARRVYILKSNGKLRPLSLPALRDRIVQRAMLMEMEPIWRSNFHALAYGFRPERGVHHAIRTVKFQFAKKERIGKRIYKIRDLARADIFDYIEVFYNRSRCHSHLGGVSPEAFEQALS